jgi:hypothetical protein
MNPTQYPTRMIMLAVLVLLFFGSAAISPAYADNLTLQPGVVFNSQVCNPVSISSGFANVTCPPTGLSELTVTTAAQGDLSTGVFGVL